MGRGGMVLDEAGQLPGAARATEAIKERLLMKA